MSHVLPLSTLDAEDQPQPSASATHVIGFNYVPGSETSTLRRVLDDAEIQAIQRALDHTGWNRKRAAALLKISYRGLLYKIRRHSITRPMARG
jgi:DNA-binding NtrC family response regulator